MIQNSSRRLGTTRSTRYRLEIQTKVDVVPFDTLARILLLLQEELPGLLVCVVNKKLLVIVDVEDFEFSDTEDWTKGKLPRG